MINYIILNTFYVSVPAYLALRIHRIAKNPKLLKAKLLQRSNTSSGVNWSKVYSIQLRDALLILALAALWHAVYKLVLYYVHVSETFKLIAVLCDFALFVLSIYLFFKVQSEITEPLNQSHNNYEDWKPPF
jgi:hypothetical protein